MSSYFGSDGKTYAPLGGSLKQGGEGAIYAVQGNGTLLMKIYPSNVSAAEAQARKAKVEAMAFAPAPAAGNIAWPLVALYGDSLHTNLVGFVMAKMQRGKNLSALNAYPQCAEVSMRDKVRVAKSIAKTLKAIQQSGFVIGDFNDDNILVTPGGNVALVDCDSFDIVAGGKHHACVAVKPGYNAPEVLRAVKGSSYQACANAGKRVFSQETDNWCLAVHIFRILFNGVHPYHCVDLPNAHGSFPAPLSNDKRVERGQTPFFKSVAGVKVPPFAPKVLAFPRGLNELFRRAFVGSHRSGIGRPSCDEWIAALEQYESELVACSANGAHVFHESQATCPYCAADQRYAQASGKPVPALGHPVGNIRDGGVRQLSGKLAKFPEVTGKLAKLPGKLAAALALPRNGAGGAAANSSSKWASDGSALDGAPALPQGAGACTGRRAKRLSAAADEHARTHYALVHVAVAVAIGVALAVIMG